MALLMKRWNRPLVTVFKPRWNARGAGRVDRTARALCMYVTRLRRELACCCER